MKVVYICLYLLASSLVAVAGLLDEAIEAYKQKDYQVAFKKFSQVANGSESAAVFISTAENKNPGVPKEELEDYWRENYGPDAKISAYFYLGILYDHGLGVTQNYVEAVDMYARAAIAGDLAAQCNLGFMYDQGHGIVQNYSKAFYWYTKAAERANPCAMRGEQKGSGVFY